MDEFVVHTAYAVQPGAEAEFMALLAHLVADVRSREPHCAGMRILQRQDATQQVIVIEAWPDRAHYEARPAAQVHLRDFIARSAALLAAPPAVSYWNASPEWERRVSLRPRE